MFASDSFITISFFEKANLFSKTFTFWGGDDLMLFIFFSLFLYGFFLPKNDKFFSRSVFFNLSLAPGTWINLMDFSKFCTYNFIFNFNNFLPFYFLSTTFFLVKSLPSVSLNEFIYLKNFISLALILFLSKSLS